MGSAPAPPMAASTSMFMTGSSLTTPPKTSFSSKAACSTPAPSPMPNSLTVPSDVSYKRVVGWVGGVGNTGAAATLIVTSAHPKKPSPALMATRGQGIMPRLRPLSQRSRPNKRGSEARQRKTSAKRLASFQIKRVIRHPHGSEYPPATDNHYGSTG